MFSADCRRDHFVRAAILRLAIGNNLTIPFRRAGVECPLRRMREADFAKSILQEQATTAVSVSASPHDQLATLSIAGVAYSLSRGTIVQAYTIVRRSCHVESTPVIEVSTDHLGSC